MDAGDKDPTALSLGGGNTFHSLNKSVLHKFKTLATRNLGRAPRFTFQLEGAYEL